MIRNRIDTSPSALQRLLLRAAFLESPQAIEEWQQWKYAIDLSGRLDAGSLRLLPPLCRNLKRCGLDDPLMNLFKGVARHAWVNNHCLFKTFQPLLEAFETAGIDFLVMGKPAMALRCDLEYPVYATSEIDLLVRQCDVQKTLNRLIAGGWRATPWLHPKLLCRYVEEAHCHIFKDSSGNQLTLHWKVILDNFGNSQDADFWSRTLPFERHALPLPLLGPTDHLVAICLSALSMPPSTLFERLVDAMLIIHREGRHIDWGHIICCAGRYRYASYLLDTLSYIHENLEGILPKGVIESLEAIRIEPAERIERLFRSAQSTQYGLAVNFVFNYHRLKNRQRLTKKLIIFPQHLQRFWLLWSLPRLPGAIVRNIITAGEKNLALTPTIRKNIGIMGYLRFLCSKLPLLKLSASASPQEEGLLTESSFPLEERLAEIRQRAGSLADSAARFWLTYGVDKKYGGFHGTLDKSGKVVPPEDKFLVQQARHLWAFSEWYLLRDNSTRVKRICDQQYSFLMRYYQNTKTNEFYSHVKRDGSLLKEDNYLYNQAFTIYGLSNYARVFQHAGAAEHALACFRAIDDRTHDNMYGGYDQSSEYRHKEINTQMHLMEAFTTLYETVHDSRVGTRLNELVDIMLNNAIQPDGHCRSYYNRMWESIGFTDISYGHDFEVAWLIMEAARVLGRMNEGSLRKKVQTLGEVSSLAGYDSQRGGYFSKGNSQGRISDRTKIWWVQAEAAAGLWWTWILSQDEIHLARLENTLDWIEKYQLNAGTGEWFAETDSKGNIIGTPNMGYDWKASYHTMRAMLYLEKWIDEVFS